MILSTYPLPILGVIHLPRIFPLGTLFHCPHHLPMVKLVKWSTYTMILSQMLWNQKCLSPSKDHMFLFIILYSHCYRKRNTPAKILVPSSPSPGPFQEEDDTKEPVRDKKKQGSVLFFPFLFLCTNVAYPDRFVIHAQDDGNISDMEEEVVPDTPTRPSSTKKVSKLLSVFPILSWDKIWPTHSGKCWMKGLLCPPLPPQLLPPRPTNILAKPWVLGPSPLPVWGSTGWKIRAFSLQCATNRLVQRCLVPSSYHPIELVFFH